MLNHTDEMDKQQTTCIENVTAGGEYQFVEDPELERR